MTDLWPWMRGADGLAVAQWASAILSVLAISIALYVFLAEQRRDNVASRRDARRDFEARRAVRQSQIDEHNQYINVCVAVVREAIDALRAERAQHPEGVRGYVDWTEYIGVPLKLRPALTTATTLLAARQNNAQLILTLSRIVQILQLASNTRSAMMVESAKQIIDDADSRLERLAAEMTANLLPAIEDDKAA